MEMRTKLLVGVPLLMAPVTSESLPVTYVQGQWNRGCQGRNVLESLPVTYVQGRWARGYQDLGVLESLSGQPEAFLEAAAVEVHLVFEALKPG
jgi:hypothetical protein